MSLPDPIGDHLRRITAGHPVTPEDQNTCQRGSEGITAPLLEPITFVATLAGANTSARWPISRSRRRLKVTLEADSTQLAAVLKLSLLSNQAFNVTIQTHDQGE